MGTLEGDSISNKGTWVRPCQSGALSRQHTRRGWSWKKIKLDGRKSLFSNYLSGELWQNNERSAQGLWLRWQSCCFLYQISPVRTQSKANWESHSIKSSGAKFVRLHFFLLADAEGKKLLIGWSSPVFFVNLHFFANLVPREKPVWCKKRKKLRLLGRPGPRTINFTDPWVA